MEKSLHCPRAPPFAGRRLGLHPREGQGGVRRGRFHGNFCRKGRGNDGVCPELFDHPLGDLPQYAHQLQLLPCQKSVMSLEGHEPDRKICKRTSMV